MAGVGGEFQELLGAARAGQEWAVADLYDTFHPPLLRYLSWAEPAVAEDLASATWLAVAERIGNFEGDARSFRAWLFTIARRRVADHRRRGARRRTDPVPDEFFAELAGPGDPGEVVVEALSAGEALARLAALLPPEQAEVLTLRVVAGLSVEETSAVVGKRPGTIRVLQHRALQRLARELRVGSSVRV